MKAFFCLPVSNLSVKKPDAEPVFSDRLPINKARLELIGHFFLPQSIKLLSDGLCNNGGGQFQAKAHTISENGFDAVVRTNLYGTWNMMQEAHDQFMGENGGHIVNIVTTNRTGMAGLSHTSAARAGVKSLSQSIGNDQKL